MTATPWVLCLWLALNVAAPAVGIERIWLTHQSAQPDKLVVNWESRSPGDSIVEFGSTPALGEQVKESAIASVHHVEIPLRERGGTYHYRVRSGEEASEIYRFKSYPEEELRI